MAVNSLTNALVPTGIFGPPDIFFGSGSILGDGTGGAATVRFQLSPGFLWVPLVCSLNYTIAEDGRWNMFGTDDALPSTILTWTALWATGTNAQAIAADVRPPRMLIQTVTSIPNIEVVGDNVNGQTLFAYVRFLRWQKATPPQAALAYLFAPP